jgi:hypothetical protein
MWREGGREGGRDDAVRLSFKQQQLQQRGANGQAVGNQG